MPHERIKPLEIELENEITELKKSSQLFSKSFFSKKRVHSFWFKVHSVVTGVTDSVTVSVGPVNLRLSVTVTLHCELALPCRRRESY